MKKKTLLCVLSTTGLLAATVVGIFSSNTFVVSNSAESAHNWNHYAAVAPTEAKSGNKEFWVCCGCHEVRLTAPGEGTITEASNPDFSTVEGGTEFNAAYLSKVETNTQNIGYTKVSKTGAETPTYEHVSGYDDVVESVDVASLDLTDYGMNSHYQRVDSSAGESYVLGALDFHLEPTVGESAYTIKLPKFNYTLYEYVTFDYGIDTWNSIWGSFGLNTAYDLRANGSVGKYGTIKFVYSGGKITVTSTITDGATLTGEITDEDIIYGRKSAELLGDSDSTNRRTFHLNHIYVKSHSHVHSVSSYDVREDKVGFKAGFCNACGQYAESSETMSVSDIVFKAPTDGDTYTVSNYGVAVTSTSGTCEWPVIYPVATYAPGDSTRVFESSIIRLCAQPTVAGGAYSGQIYMNLPKIDFTAYSTVVIKFQVNSGATYIGTGSGAGENVFIPEECPNGLITFTNNSGEISMTISSVEDPTATFVTTITDASTRVGDKAVNLYICANLYRNIVFAFDTLTPLA